MIILAVETSMGPLSVAVLRSNGGEPHLSVHRGGALREPAENLLPAIEAVLGEARITYAEITRLAVTVGPGSFTGIRAGLSAIRGLRLALGPPVVALTSLEVMAHQVWGAIGKNQPFAVAAPAGRDGVYLQCFDGSGIAVSALQVITVEEAWRHLPEAVVLIAGSPGTAIAAFAGRAAGRRLSAILPDMMPDAATLAKLAVAREPGLAPPAPVYVKPADAKPQQNKVLPRIGDAAGEAAKRGG